jgi:hypothetical protein
MSFLYFHFIFLEQFLFLGVVYLLVTLLFIMLFHDGINQILVGINSSLIAVLVQFNGISSAIP